MTDTQVWVGDCHTNLKHIVHVSYEHPDHHKGFLDKALTGLPIEPNEVPKFIFQTERSRKISDFAVVSGDVHVVSPRLAEVLRGFDLGADAALGPGQRRVELYPMELRAADKTTRLDDLFMLYVATQKDSFVRELSEGVNKRIQRVILLASRHRDEQQIVLTPAALEGPDLWREAGVVNGYFFSDRLVKAIRAAGIREIGFMPCLLTEPGAPLAP